ncbi:hypothetical protein [Roseixanthobacter pseudopolyaromaticivorans]|uniref:hypothetical protein n=1 Tax=Xanthobacteraceae TaxID=335928 RepID=UPI003726B12D
MAAILAWVVTLLAPFKKYLAIFGLIGSALAWAFLKGRKGGVASERASQEEAVKQVEQRWDATDRAPLDFDGAIERLRDRSRSGG